MGRSDRLLSASPPCDIRTSRVQYCFRSFAALERLSRFDRQPRFGSAGRQLFARAGARPACRSPPAPRPHAALADARANEWDRTLRSGPRSAAAAPVRRVVKRPGQGRLGKTFEDFQLILSLPAVANRPLSRSAIRRSITARSVDAVAVIFSRRNATDSSPPGPSASSCDTTVPHSIPQLHPCLFQFLTRQVQPDRRIARVSAAGVQTRRSLVGRFVPAREPPRDGREHVRAAKPVSTRGPHRALQDQGGERVGRGQEEMRRVRDRLQKDRKCLFPRCGQPAQGDCAAWRVTTSRACSSRFSCGTISSSLPARSRSNSPAPNRLSQTLADRQSMRVVGQKELSGLEQEFVLKALRGPDQVSNARNTCLRR